MANNFKLLSNRIRNRIRLNLSGDFDGSSAWELLNTLKNYSYDSYHILIDTNRLSTIHPFGIEVFKKNLGVLAINISNISITGKNRIYLES